MHSIMSGSDRQHDTVLPDKQFIRNLQEPSSALDFFSRPGYHGQLNTKCSIEVKMANITEVTEATFENEVLTDYSKPVLVDFSAVWCGPCKMLDPIVEELAQEWSNLIKVVKLDVDNNASIAMKYQVMGVPTLILFKDGEPQERVTGYQPKDRLVTKFAPHLN
jgi:thioredoxin 1